ncbi:sugar phosphate isomerase/epimerase [Mesorhizobium sp. M0833]|uniref:sugar phosphate isomerase/epimerase family protein n=1 Tax=Mesorhizobium sp. M0833 TaxID=2957009 RepID=UPI00333812C9
MVSTIADVPEPHMSRTVNSYMMPFSNVAHLSLTDKFRATQLAGFKELSLMPRDVERLIEGGKPASDIVAEAADHGVRITRLDPLNTWPRIWRPDNMDEAYIATVNTPPDQFFRLTDALGCTHASLNATFPLNAMSTDEITEHYVAICARAAAHGLKCDLEFIPLWGVPTLEMAWNVVRDSGASNGGLVFDVWHFVRGGSDIGLLKTISGDMIHCVQVNDGPLALPKGVTIKDNCYDRQFPGDGEFPNAEILRILAETGGLNQVGPEVFSPTLTLMSVEAVARKSAESTRNVLLAAGLAV